MRLSRVATIVAATILVVLFPRTGRAQDIAAPASVSARMAALHARLDSLEAGTCPTKPMSEPSGLDRTDSTSAALDRLAARVEAFRLRQCDTRQQTPAAADDLAALRAAAEQAVDSDSLARVTADTQFIGRQRDGSALNPEISATGDIRLVAREGRQEDNGVAREVEVALQSALDPYSFAKIFLTFEDDEVGVEESYIYWTGLPGHLRVDAGKFRQQIGDLNRWHRHALPESEYPLVYQRFLGAEGLSGVGLSLYTALPLSLAGGTHEVWAQGTTSESEPLYAGGRQPTLLLRLQNFWQLSRSAYAQLGATATGGNNDDLGLKSRLAGLDFRLTWRPPDAGTRKEVTFRAEGYRLHSSEAAATTNRYGTFVDLSAKLSRRWVVATRYDWVESPRGPADTEWRVTPSLTWWQSEFVFLRLEGEHRNSEMEGSQNMLTLQAVFAMGPHKHETY